MYYLMSRHYGDNQSQLVTTHKRKWQAHREMLRQGEILKGYYKRTGIVDGQFIVFGDEDIHLTTLYIKREG